MKTRSKEKTKKEKVRLFGKGSAPSGARRRNVLKRGGAWGKNSWERKLNPKKERKASCGPADRQSSCHRRWPHRIRTATETEPVDCIRNRDYYLYFSVVFIEADWTDILCKWFDLKDPGQKRKDSTLKKRVVWFHPWSLPNMVVLSAVLLSRAVRVLHLDLLKNCWSFVRPPPPPTASFVFSYFEFIIKEKERKENEGANGDDGDVICSPFPGTDVRFGLQRGHPQCANSSRTQWILFRIQCRPAQGPRS